MDRCVFDVSPELPCTTQQSNKHRAPKIHIAQDRTSPDAFPDDLQEGYPIGCIAQ
jgi:hypothetical protein